MPQTGLPDIPDAGTLFAPEYVPGINTATQLSVADYTACVMGYPVMRGGPGGEPALDKR